MQSWFCLVIGVVLMMLELLLPSGFFLLILGGSAVVVGALVGLGLFATWIPQAIVFCVVAVLTWLLLGKKLRNVVTASRSQHGQLVGAVVKVTQTISPGGSGTGELWGASWRMLNVDSVQLEGGSEAVVVGSEGITLQVRRVQA